MTIITSTQFRANQSKYIRMAQKGERVILSSRAGSAELVPISEEDKKFNEYVHSPEFYRVMEEAVEEYNAGKTLKFDSASAAQKWLDEL